LLLKRLFPFCLLVISLALIGCGGGGPKMIPVTGVVTFEGKPIGKINVMFVPADTKGIIAQGTTEENGKFTLQSLEPGDGAMSGEYKIAFKYVSDVIPDMPGFTGGVKPEPSPIPLKYVDAEKSGFTATVSSDKTDFKFDLVK
jgi:hypothetical protein